MSNELSPEVLKLIETMQQGILAAQQNAFTEDKMALLIEKMKAPYVDPNKLARDKKEQLKAAQDGDRMRSRAQERIDRCPHKDDNLKWLIWTVHNMPDGQTWGKCSDCHGFINPSYRWIDASGEEVIVPAHSLYPIVQQLDLKKQ